MFIQKLTEQMLARDYIIVPQLCDNPVISNNSQYLTFFKHSGTILYAVALLNTGLMPDATRAYTALYNRFHGYCASVRCTQAYFIGIFIGTNPQVAEFCNHSIEDYTAFNLEIRWLLDPETGKITVQGSQPDRVIDLGEIIEAAFGEANVAYSPGVHMDTLVKKEADRRKGTIVSHNIALTLLLLLANVIMLCLTYGLGGINDYSLLDMGALYLPYIREYHQYYRLISAAFLHVGPVHLISNMLFLYVFGSTIERYYGKLRFGLIYLLSALGGNIMYCLFAPQGLAVGASGAVFGLTGCLLAYSIKIKRAVEGRDSYFMLMFLLVSILMGFVNNNLGTHGVIANTAHIGGAFVGFVLGLALYRSNNNEE